MTITPTVPPLNATGRDASTSDLMAPPPPPPLNASNHPDDHTRGEVGEIAPAEARAIEDARTGADQVPALEETAKPAAPVETNPAGKQPVEPNGPDEPGDSPIPDGSPEWAVRELTKTRNQRRSEKARADVLAAEKTAAEAAKTAAEARAAELQAEIEALKAKPPEPPKPPEVIPEPPRPARDQFDTPEAYDAAMDTWATSREARAAEIAKTTAAAEAEAARVAAETKARADKVKETKDAEDARIAGEMQKRQQAWNAKRDKATETRPDFVEVTTKLPADGGPTITPLMADAILDRDNGADVAYHLGKNPVESARIAGLPPVQQIAEIGALSATLASAAVPRVSSVPAPITPLTSSREGAQDTQREESMAEVAARVAEREGRRRTGMWNVGPTAH